MIAIDFFCGAGGLTRGFLDAGIQVVLGIDVNADCKETYELNNSPATFLHTDIRHLLPTNIKHIVSGIPRSELLFAACAPCQPFTKQRRDRLVPYDKTLLGHFSRFVSEFKPGQLFIENVPGIRKVSGLSTYRRFVKLLDHLGYKYCEGIVDAKSFGVPQTRRRYVMIAAMDYKPSLPLTTHGPDKLPYMTVRNAIATYPSIKAGESHPNIPNHRASMLSVINLTRICQTSCNGGDRRDWPAKLKLKCHQNGYKGHTDVYGRMWWDKPAPALTCRFDSLSNGRYGHPKQNRAISLREGARLQGFADNYVFHGNSKAHLAAQIGNAVAVGLAKAMGKHLLTLQHQSQIGFHHEESESFVTV